MISSEDEPDQTIINRLNFIKENTHEKVLLPLSTTEMAILSNLGSNIGKVIEFKDNEGRDREYALHTLIKYAKESYFELATFVVKIGKKYSLDIPMRTQQGQVFEMPTAPDLIAMDSGAPSSQPSQQSQPNQPLVYEPNREEDD